jgi:hypothetical protein
VGGDVHARPGGPDAVYKIFEQDYGISQGPESVYVRPSERAGLGWDVDIAAD